MKRAIRVWQLAGFVTVSVLGTLLHFLYDWTGSGVVALVSAVNESTWEHMKLLFFPLLLFAVVEHRGIGREDDRFWCIKLQGMLLGLGLIPVLFYTLRGVFGITPDWVNILLFFVSAAAALFYETRRLEQVGELCSQPHAAVVGTVLLAAAFMLFTVCPPHIPLFQDPVDGSYGV